MSRCFSSSSSPFNSLWNQNQSVSNDMIYALNPLIQKIKEHPNSYIYIDSFNFQQIDGLQSSTSLWSTCSQLAKELIQLKFPLVKTKITYQDQSNTSSSKGNDEI